MFTKGTTTNHVRFGNVEILENSNNTLIRIRTPEEDELWVAASDFVRPVKSANLIFSVDEIPAIIIFNVISLISSRPERSQSWLQSLSATSPNERIAP